MKFLPDDKFEANIHTEVDSLRTKINDNAVASVPHKQTAFKNVKMRTSLYAGVNRSWVAPTITLALALPMKARSGSFEYPEQTAFIRRILPHLQ